MDFEVIQFTTLQNPHVLILTQRHQQTTAIAAKAHNIGDKRQQETRAIPVTSAIQRKAWQNDQ